MSTLNPYQQYAQNQITTAPAEELTLMLYKGAVKFIALAMKGLEEKKLDQVNENIIRAQDIYSELLATLDRQYDISKNLAQLYDFMLHILTQANVKKEMNLLKQASDLAKQFVETWEEAIKIYRRSQGAKRSEIG
ncbi:MAG: flagellar export chaperone FliS [Thermincola sp.]|nr:flagellar export chaperone FliS [Thermincola sp.]MDT3703372.1 flagellar export chaperone FliS [Thermincola sp.]